MTIRFAIRLVAVLGLAHASGGWPGAWAQSAPDTAAAEAVAFAEPVPASVPAGAVAAVTRLGEQVVQGHYQVALERMNPLWKERTCRRIGGMAKLEKQLAEAADAMVRQGITMLAFKPVGAPIVHQVAPARRMVEQGGTKAERFAHTKWLVLVPTVTRFRILHSQPGQAARPVTIESTGFQVAICDKGTDDWTFIDGASLTRSDLRSLFITLPKDMELPAVGKREVR